MCIKYSLSCVTWCRNFSYFTQIELLAVVRGNRSCATLPFATKEEGKLYSFCRRMETDLSEPNSTVCLVSYKSLVITVFYRLIQVASFKNGDGEGSMCGKVDLSRVKFHEHVPYKFWKTGTFCYMNG